MPDRLAALNGKFSDCVFLLFFLRTSLLLLEVMHGSVVERAEVLSAGIYLGRCCFLRLDFQIYQQ